jgi:hypothetical protein
MGKNDVIGKQIFWSALQSQDAMAKYKDKSFKNDPSVPAEYVKFLIMNTGMDVVDQLLKQVTILEEKVGGMVNEVKTSEAKESSASNAISIANKNIDALVNRVSALEARK